LIAGVAMNININSFPPSMLERCMLERSSQC